MEGSPNSRFSKWNGILLIIMLISAFILDLVLMRTTGDVPALDIENISSELLRAKSSSIWPIETWLYTLMAIPGLLFVAYVNSTLQGSNKTKALEGANYSAITFWIFHTLHNVVILTVLQGLAANYTPEGPVAAVVEVQAVTLLRFTNLLFGFGSNVGLVFLIISLVIYSYLGLRIRGIGKWISWIGIGGSIAMLLSYLRPIFPMFVAVGLLGWVLFIVWVAGMTFVQVD